jgi:hypothetical protein
MHSECEFKICIHNIKASSPHPILESYQKPKQQSIILPQTLHYKHKRLPTFKMKPTVLILIFLFILATLGTAIPVTSSSLLSRSRASLAAMSRLRKELSATYNPNAEDEMFIPRKISLTEWPSLRQLHSLGLSNSELLRSRQDREQQ